MELFVGDGLFEVDEGAGEGKDEVEDVFADGAGVGGGGGEDGDAAALAGVLVDVVEADAGAADDLEFGAVGEEFVGDEGVGADDDGVGGLEGGAEFSGSFQVGFNDLGVFAEPGEGDFSRGLR